MKYGIRFKNLVIYQFTQPFELTGEQLEAKLQQRIFRHCGSQDVNTYGWVPALGKTANALVHEVNDCLLVCAAKEEKLLPASVITDALEEKIDAIEQEQDRTVFSKERKALRDDIIMELLPKAFTKTVFTRAYIDQRNGWLIVNGSSFKQAEQLTSCLRECLGSLPIINPPLKNLPSFTMTQWLKHKTLPKGFVLGESCELRDPSNEGGTIIARNEALNSGDIDQHLASRKGVSKLHIHWQDTLSFVMNEDLRITQMKYNDVFQDKLDDIDMYELLQELDANFVCMSGTFGQLLTSLFSEEVFGELQA